MKILIASHAQYITAGLPKVIEFAEAMSALGNEVVLCVTSKTRKFGVVEHSSNGVRIIETPSLLSGRLRHGVDIFDLINRIRVLKDTKFDIIHCMASRPTVFYPALFLKRKHASTLIYEWEDSFAESGVALERSGPKYYKLFGRVEKYFEEEIVKYADGIIVVSDFPNQRASSLGARGDRIFQQVKGSRLVGETLQERAHAKREVLPDSLQGKTILAYVGTIYKNDLAILFEAFSKVSSRCEEARLLLVGYNTEHPSKIPDKVTIIPRVPISEYLAYLAATDLFVLPLACSMANIARYPSKFSDYLACGRPVVSTPIPVVSRIINEAKCGYLTADDTSDALGASILAAIDDRSNWECLGARSRDYARMHFSWNTIATRTVNFYNHINGLH